MSFIGLKWLSYLSFLKMWMKIDISWMLGFVGNGLDAVKFAAVSVQSDHLHRPIKIGRFRS